MSRSTLVPGNFKLLQFSPTVLRGKIAVSEQHLFCKGLHPIFTEKHTPCWKKLRQIKVAKNLRDPYYEQINSVFNFLTKND